MARQNSQKTVSLFPFLAVLVCTMGALILLLLVTTRRIRQDLQNSMTETSTVVSEEADDAPLFDTLDSQVIGHDGFSEPVAAEESFVINPEDFERSEPFDEANGPAIHLKPPEERSVNALHRPATDRQDEVNRLSKLLAAEKSRHEKLQEQIHKARLQIHDAESDPHQAQMEELSALRLQETELSQELIRKQKQLAHMQTELETKSETTEDAETLLRSRESDLVSLREIVKQAESASGTDSTFLDFTNSTGTQRSPIVINVTESGFEFLPSSIKVSTNDMKGFPANDNPLLAGVTAVHEHRFPDSATVKPYVLLLVRPSGSLQFYAVQRTLTEAGIHFGYELVEQDRRISAGAISADETNVLRNSVLDALQRRDRLYSGLVAGVQKSDQSPERDMRVMPDGRVLFPDDAKEGDDGRFYAGGEAPPQQLSEILRKPSGEPVDPEDLFGPKNMPETPLSPETADSSAASWDEEQWDRQIARRSDDFAQQDRTTDGLASSAEPDFSGSGPNESKEDAGIPEIIPKQLADRDQEDAPETIEDTEDLFVEAFPELQNMDAEDLADLSPSQILGRPGAISGNLGVGGGGGYDVPSSPGQPNKKTAADGSAGKADDDTPSGSDDIRPKPADFSLFGMNSGQTGEGSAESSTRRPGSPTTNNAIGNMEADRTDSRERFDWPDPATADAGQESRTVEPPENPFGPALQTPPTGINGGSEVAASDSQSRLLQLMQRNQDGSSNTFSAQADSADPADTSLGNTFSGPQKKEHAAASKHSDPLLRTMLKTAEANDPELAGYYPVQVHIARNTLKVGSFVEVDISEVTPDRIFRITLNALADEVQLLPASEQDGTVPAIDYVVGPGAGPIQQRLEKSLQRMDVPTRTILNVGPATASDLIRTEGYRQHPQTPVSEQKDPNTGQRRLSL